MTDAMKVSPPRFPPGPVQGVDLEHALAVMYRDFIARFDPRYPNNDFKDGLVATGANKGVVLGNQAMPVGRISPVVTLTSKIADNGRAADSRFLPTVHGSNKYSIQNIAPLSAMTNGSTATINVAAHNVQYGYGQVSYHSGTISGLLTNTAYRVYAKDPEYAGGAVSYLATTNPQTVTSDNGHYYVGSCTTIFSATAFGIDIATTTNPITMQTHANHGWLTGDAITFSGMPGDFAVLNGNTYPITVLSANTFSILIDGSAFAGYAGGGTGTRQSASSTGGAGAGGGSAQGVLL